MLNRNPSVITRFLIAFLKGERDTLAAVRDNRVVDQEILVILSKWTDIPAETIALTVPPGIDPSGSIDLADLNRQQDSWVQEGMVATKADLERFVDYQYQTAAVAQLR
jgi:hypothetical protein